MSLRYSRYEAEWLPDAQELDLLANVRSSLAATVGIARQVRLDEKRQIIASLRAAIQQLENE